MNVKLTFRPIFRYGASPNWFLTKKSEVVAYITDRYFAWKKYNDCGLPAGYNGCALKFAGYTIKTASKSEIFLCFWVKLNSIICMLSLVITLIITSLYPN